MKNVLLLGECYSGGVKTYIDSIVHGHEPDPEIRVQALVSSKRLEKAERIEGDYFVEDALSFGKSPLKVAVALKSLHRVVKENDIHVIHANSTFAGLVMYPYTFLKRDLYYLYTPHGYFSFRKMGRLKKAAVRFVERQINHRAALIIHVSPSEEREALSQRLVPDGKSIVILNGTKDPEVKTDRDHRGIFTVVNLARVDDPKNPFDFIEIARKAVEAKLPIQFIWAGNGKYLENARDKVKHYGMTDEIKFIGYSDEKDIILQKSDLYFSTSQYEGLPFAVVEAMSYKLPLLLSHIVGHSDLIEESENGLLFKDMEDPAIYEFLRLLIHDREQWQSLSAASYRIFCERFKRNHMLKSLLGIYREGRQ